MRISKKRFRKICWIAAAGMACGTLILCFASHRLVERSSSPGMFELDDVPKREVALVLGCARYLSNGRENLFFKFRIEQASALFSEGKASYLLVSGDNSRAEYDEPSDMRDALIERGVPREAIVLDCAGFSTLDSIIRAREVFGLDRLTVVSQEFHARRAVFIGRANGMDVVGVAAKDVSGVGGAKTIAREYLARAKTVLDVYILGRDPKFLGDPIPIGS